jgi:hypothetical protein
MQTLLGPQVSIRSQERNFRNLLNRIHFSPRAGKVTVILLFTFCWLCVALVRSNVPRHNVHLEGSSLMGLSTYLQQGGLSGRDFQSRFGPATQFLAWMATSITKTQSSLDAYGMIIFLFCAASASLIAAMLLVCDRVSWQDSAIVYAFCFILNLFFDVLDFRIALLLLNAAFAYRITATETMRQQTIWATATGLLCFGSQLVTFELGIYAVLVVVCALIAGSLLTRSLWVLFGIEVFVATLAAANIALVVFFKLTSANYRLMFDYQNYSLEILHGYHNSMGMLWQLPTVPTVVLILATAYVIGKCIMFAKASDPIHASLFASLVFAAVVWVSSAFISSDIPHIITAFSPMIVVLGLLATNECKSRLSLAAWALAVGGLLFVWPSFNLNVPMDVFRIVRGEVGVQTAIRNLYAPKKPFKAQPLPLHLTSEAADRRGISVLSFPYDNHIGVGVRRPFFAPVLESYAASTDSLEQYYIEALDRQRRAGLDIIYGPDDGAVPHVKGTQAITRTPGIFEYIYRHFELVGNDDHEDGHYKLRERHQPRDVVTEDLQFSVLHQIAQSGTLKLDAPSTCGLVRMQLEIEYTKNTLVFRPSGIELSLSDGDQLVWQGSIKPLELNRTFFTYVSPLPREDFHKVFGQDPVQVTKWDKIEYTTVPTDLLGSAATRILIGTIQCVDPQKFVEATPATKMAIAQ